MEFIRNYAILFAFVLCSSNVFPLENISTVTEGSNLKVSKLKVSNLRLTNLEESNLTVSDSEISRRRAKEAYQILSGTSRRMGILTKIGSQLASTFTSFLNADTVMDTILQFLRNVIRERNLDRIKIPDFEETFTSGILLLPVTGSFKGKDVWLESTLSIARKGEARVKLNNTSVIINSTLGLDSLRLGMNYTAELSYLWISGDLTAEVGSNAVSFSGVLDFSPGTCRVYLKKLKIIELGNITFQISGLGLFNWLYGSIVNWVTFLFHNYIKYTIETTIKDILHKQMSEMRCPL